MEKDIFQQVVNLGIMTTNGLSGQAAAAAKARRASFIDPDETHAVILTVSTNCLDL